MKYRGFLFDLDGTLIDTTELIVQSFNHTLNWIAGVSVPREQIVGLIGRPLYDQLKMHLKDCSEESIEKAMDEHMHFQIRNWRQYVGVFGGVEELLQHIKMNGAHTAIVTSRKERTTKLYLEELGLIKYFDLLVTPETTKEHKPSPEPALYAMNRLNLKNEESVFIGDSVFDMQCAKSAEISAIFVTWGSGKENEIRDINVDNVVSDMKNIYSII